jgi:COMPASS component SWD1
VDVTTVQPISAYYSSDEDQGDEDVLLYLPIAPEVEEPEDGWNPTIEGMEDKAGVKRSHDQKENSSPKKKRTKSYDISLANAPSDGKQHSYSS